MFCPTAEHGFCLRQPPANGVQRQFVSMSLAKKNLIEVGRFLYFSMCGSPTHFTVVCVP